MENFHLIYVICVLLILPLLSIAFDKERKSIDTGIKWFVFWALGVRLFTAGIVQVFNSSYTADFLLQIEMSDYLVVRELGFCNIAMGTLAILSLFWEKYRKPASICVGIFISGAMILHIIRIEQINFSEFVSLAGDVFIVVIAVLCIVRDRVKVK